MTKAEMQERLIDFAVSISEVVDALPQKRYATYLGGQLERSGTSPALNYGEASAAESIKDLLHKDKIILKELQETFVGLKIISKKGYCDDQLLIPTLQENNELISIFVKACKGLELKLGRKNNGINHLPK